MSTKICIIYPMDPYSPKADGIQTCIKDFIKYAPEDFAIELIGFTSDKIRSPLKKWQRLKLGEKEFGFFPLLYENRPDQKRAIPMSFRLVAALSMSRLCLSKRLILFNRIEPATLFSKTSEPKVAIIHNDIQEQILGKGSEVLWSRIPWLYFLFEKNIFKSLDLVYTVSQKTLRFYQSRYPNNKAKFFFLAVWADTDKFQPTDEAKPLLRQRLNLIHKFLPLDKEWILFVGRLQEQKAPQRLMDSFYEYHKRNSGSIFIILGDGNARKNMEYYAQKLGLERNVFFLGSISQDEVVDFYRASDVLLLTSNFEGMPRCILEALACGLPVVSTDVGEIKRVVKDNFCGEVAKSFAPFEIAAALNKVLNNPLVYTKLNCTSCISEYTPQHVLRPIYEKMRLLYKEKCMLKEGS